LAHHVIHYRIPDASIEPSFVPSPLPATGNFPAIKMDPPVLSLSSFPGFC
jgi:hypothetical protein